jgi:hypothetical protein
MSIRTKNSTPIHIEGSRRGFFIGTESTVVNRYGLSHGTYSNYIFIDKMLNLC